MTFTAPDPRRPFAHRMTAFALGLCLFAIVVGANWATFERFGSDLPDWDQWDAEATDLLRPWFEHDHFVAHLFQPHSEHRIVLTKLQNLGVVLATGQWDSRVESFFNAFLHAAIAVALWEMGRRWLARSLLPPFFLLIAALYSLPLAWQNLLGGFHSQQYWLILTSFAAIALLPFAEIGTAAWWSGLAAAVLALGSMASGLLAAAVVAGIIIWRWVGRCFSPPAKESPQKTGAASAAAETMPLRGDSRDEDITNGGLKPTRLRASTWLTLAVMVALIIVGAATQVSVPYHEPLKAKSAHDFLLNLIRSLAWPVENHDWAAVILWAPWTILLLVAGQRLFNRRTASSRSELTVIALGGWVFVQLLATAYARGAGGDYPASRYMDTLIFSTAVNGLALGWFFSGGFLRHRSVDPATGVVSPHEPAVPVSAKGAIDLSRPMAAQAPDGGIQRKAMMHRGVKPLLQWGLAFAWTASLAWGLTILTDRNVHHELPDVKSWYLGKEAHIRSYLRTNDVADLVWPIPYPNADALVERLSHPSIRAQMPSTVRPPLPVRPASDTDATGFAENDPVRSPLDHGSVAGLSPTTPELTGWTTWGSYTAKGTSNTGEWRSATIPPPRTAWLRMETAGNVGAPGISLELRDASSNDIIAEVRPSKIPGDSWRTAYVRAPHRPFVIVATDRSPQGWLAFSPPVEMPALSHLAWWLMKSGLFIAELAAGAALIIALAAGVCRTRFRS